MKLKCVKQAYVAVLNISWEIMKHKCTRLCLLSRDVPYLPYTVFPNNDSDATSLSAHQVVGMFLTMMFSLHSDLLHNHNHHLEECL